jgi:hypothetical protein
LNLEGGLNEQLDLDIGIGSDLKRVNLLSGFVGRKLARKETPLLVNPDDGKN